MTVSIPVEVTVRFGSSLAGASFVACDASGPEAIESLRIDEREAHTLVEMLGAAQVQANVDALRQTVEGATIDWLPIVQGSPFDGRTIGEGTPGYRRAIDWVKDARTRAN